MKKKKVGLALGGGAARGMAHIGVLEVLQREGIPIDMIAGTSIGGMVGAFCARGQDSRLMREMALKINMVKMLTLADLTLPKSGLFGGKAVINLLQKMMGKDIKFDELPIPLALVATDIITGEEVVIDRGSVLEGVRASISIPGIFTLAKWRGHYLVDGGLVNPVPVSVLKKMGADFIIAVNVMPDMDARVRQLKKGSKKKGKEPNIFNVILQSLYISTYIIAKASAEGADITISPDTTIISPGDFHRARECIEQGVIAAQKAMPEIKRKLSQAGGYDIVKL
jgi:NTE family protein